MSELTPERLAEIKARAEKQAAAYDRMCELNGGVGMLGVREPAMFEDMQVWSDSTENDHADTVLDLLAEMGRLQGDVHDAMAYGDACRDEVHAQQVEIKKLRAERDALQAKLDQVRAWSEERSMLTASGKLVSGVPGLSAILDGKEQDDD